MQTLRKKTSPLKYKNETTRFLGDGVSFKAKLIGILEVSEARGDRMCQEALSDLKMAIRAAGEHKQRITINIAIDGLRLRDEKTGDSLYHHPVHKISFIAQDMTDSRAFGYIFGSPDTGHRFFGIKTDKAASQVVIAMRDLFQVVFALKKKEIELAKQHLEKTCYPTSPLFSDSSGSSSKLQSVPHVSIKSTAEAKIGSNTNDSKSSGTAVADLVDLELELNSLQQGLNQMERITPSDPFGSKDDPFGDSFISYPSKPILPPPPSSGRERSSRTSDSSSLFSPKTPHTGVSVDTSSTEKKKDFSFSHDLNSSHEEPSSGDWFTSSAGNSIFEDSPRPVQELSKDEKHEQTKQEILSQFDVFTELDPLELKNPPKKALNDLVSHTSQEQTLFNTSFNQITAKPAASSVLSTLSTGVFTTDPFGEDPFVKEDPFADSDFSKQDPFETEFANFSINQNNLEKFKFDAKKDNLQTLLQSNLSKSPKSSILEKQMSLMTSSPKTVQFSKQNTFDAQFDKFDDRKYNKLSQLHENPSLDISSESECAPEPPPRPTTTLMQIKPPPLPPKKQTNDLTVKPPPRPPYHTDDSCYDFIEKYETAPNSLESNKNLETSPPLPVPARKSKFESDFTLAPERPKKQFNISSSEEDYLTPISLPERNTDILLPPPQKNIKKQNTSVTVPSFLESKPPNTCDNLNTPLEGLDITLSQLTLSGLNELAHKLNIPASQLSNMTLVQLTNFLSNFIKSSNSSSSMVPDKNMFEESFPHSNSGDFPAFQADFAANFNNFNNPSELTYDRYAVFRELMQEEIKQTKIDSEPEEILEEKEKFQNSVNSNVNLNLKPLIEEPSNNYADKYAALREIVEIELKQSELDKDETINQIQNEIEDIAEEEEDIEEEENVLNENNVKDTEDINIINRENKFVESDKERHIISPIKSDIIEYSMSLDNKESKIQTPIKSPIKSPVKTPIVKSPIPNSAVTEIVQNNTRLTSGSLSDVVSGSSPEVDNTASNSDIGKKNVEATGESWAIFDQGTVPSNVIKEKQSVQSEEGVSPWSSDSKEFGNGSPPDWRSKGSGSGTEQWSKRRKDQEGWWDTSAEPEVQYYASNRRSTTDSYDDECYECYERPRRRKRGNWQHGGQATGGHSSSSRDVSPWEEEPRMARMDGREARSSYRHPRGHSFERHRDRRHTDSWDDDDDYEYDEEQDMRIHWTDRHSRDTDRESRHSTGSRDHENDRWADDWNEDRRHRRRRGDPRDRWCCPDWEQNEHDKPPRYGTSSRWTNPEMPVGKWRDRKLDDRYYSRESQESPWEDEYSNDPEDTVYLSVKRGWKQRPSSASEMDRKTGEIKSRHHLGGSDGERDRRYKSGRRSRSKDSQYSEPSHRFKTDLGPPIRPSHRSKPHVYSKPLDSNFTEVPPKKSLECKLESNKKSSSLSRKKTKDIPKTEENISSTFPRKTSSRAKSLFENDFVTSEDSPVANSKAGAKFNYDNDLETSEAESPTVNRSVRAIRQQILFEKNTLPLDRDFKDRHRGGSFKDSKLSPRYQAKSKSLFEDDFSPSQKVEQLPEDNSISSIKEIDPEEEDSFGTNNLENAANGRKRILSKNRLSGSLRSDANLKKSESINIFARESDPFDDDFFCEEDAGLGDEKSSPRNTELRWTEDFENCLIKKN